MNLLEFSVTINSQLQHACCRLATTELGEGPSSLPSNSEGVQSKMHLSFLLINERTYNFQPRASAPFPCTSLRERRPRDTERGGATTAGLCLLGPLATLQAIPQTAARGRPQSTAQDSPHTKMWSASSTDLTELSGSPWSSCW